MDSNPIAAYHKLGAGVRDLSTAQPEIMAGFAEMHRAVQTDGALTAKAKELTALAIAISTQCRGCIIFHVHDAIKFGATREEVSETIGVAVLMGGGPSVVYGTEALQTFDETVGPHRPPLPEGDGPTSTSH